MKKRVPTSVILLIAGLLLVSLAFVIMRRYGILDPSVSRAVTGLELLVIISFVIYHRRQSPKA